MLNKELDKLCELQQELTAMEFLGADDDDVKKLMLKISKQKNKVYNIIKTAPADPKE